MDLVAIIGLQISDNKLLSAIKKIKHRKKITKRKRERERERKREREREKAKQTPYICSTSLKLSSGRIYQKKNKNHCIASLILRRSRHNSWSISIGFIPIPIEFIHQSLLLTNSHQLEHYHNSSSGNTRPSVSRIATSSLLLHTCSLHYYYYPPLRPNHP